METNEIINTVLAIPMVAVLLYLLIKEQSAHSETRAKCMQLSADMMEKYITLQHEVLEAIDKMTPGR